MGNFQSAGSNVPSRIVFNSGTIDFGNNRLVNVNDMTLTVKWSTAPLYVLNSIKIANLARHSETVSLSGNISSFSPELEMMTMGSSTAGAPLEIDTLDGQPTLQSPVITCFDINGKQIQYQFINAIFTSDTLTLSQENYAKWAFNMEATDIKLLTTI